MLGNVQFFMLTQFLSLLSVCFPALPCWTPCCSNQQHLKMPQFREHCSMTQSTPSAGLCFDQIITWIAFYFCCYESSVFAVCSNGFVEGRHIMKLRQQLQKHGYSQSFTTDEKGLLIWESFSGRHLFCLKWLSLRYSCYFCLSDPEEFLSVIMHHILALDPLLKLYTYYS